MAFDVERHVEHWRSEALDELRVADKLMRENELRQAMYFYHLALEKALKAHVVKVTENHPPFIHTLSELNRLAGIEVTPRFAEILADVNVYQIRGRYGRLDMPPLDRQQAEIDSMDMKEVFKWLMQRL